MQTSLTASITIGSCKQRIFETTFYNACTPSHHEKITQIINNHYNYNNITSLYVLHTKY